MRVIAGQAKGKKLLSVPGVRTRPITDRVKEALFAVLGGAVEGAAFLDLFAGTGSVGIEALSRGAEQAVFVERGRQAGRILRRNLQLTGLAGRAKVVQDDVFKFIAREKESEESFDFIYVAPPQYKGLWVKTLQALDKALEKSALLAEGGQVIVQIHPKEYEPLSLKNLALREQRRYGSTLLCFFERST